MTEKPCPCGWSHASDVMESRVALVIEKQKHHEAARINRILLQLGAELQQLPGWAAAQRNCRRYLQHQADYQAALMAAQHGISKHVKIGV